MLSVDAGAGQAVPEHRGPGRLPTPVYDAPQERQGERRRHRGTYRGDHLSKRRCQHSLSSFLLSEKLHRVVKPIEPIDQLSPI